MLSSWEEDSLAGRRNPLVARALLKADEEFRLPLKKAGIDT